MTTIPGARYGNVSNTQEVRYMLSRSESYEVPAQLSPLLEFTGKLTAREMRKWTRWFAFRSSLRLFIRACVLPSVGMVGIAAINNKGRPLSVHDLLGPLLVLSLLVFLWIAFSGSKMLVRSLKYNPSKHSDTTVRFYDDRMEMITGGLVNQFRWETVRILRTRFGIACVSRRSHLPMFLLPFRVLTNADTVRLLALAASHGGQHRSELHRV